MATIEIMILGDCKSSNHGEVRGVVAKMEIMILGDEKGSSYGEIEERVAKI